VSILRTQDLPFSASGLEATRGGGQDLTVVAVEMEVRAALSIDRRCGRFENGGRDMAESALQLRGHPFTNPFWLASAPPTDKAYNVNRAFEAAGAVWCGRRSAKTRRS